MEEIKKGFFQAVRIKVLRSRIAVLMVIVCCFQTFICKQQLMAQNDTASAQSSVDTNYVKKWERNNVMELFSGIYSTQFSFTNTIINRKSFKLVANSSFYTGIYLNYKWLWFKYSWAIPGTYLAKDIKLKYNDIQFRFNTRRIIFHPFFESYNGLLYYVPKSNKKYDPFRNMQYTNWGVELLYYLNVATFSFEAANDFSDKQIKSSGSAVLGLTPKWQHINWKTPSNEMIKDSLSYHFFSSDPSWISLIANVGYHYNFAIKRGKYHIAPAATIGSGIVSEIKDKAKKFHPAIALSAWINAGYNGHKWYSYINGSWSYGKAFLPIRNVNKANTDVSLTLGYRFGNFRKKIAGIL